jgi:hypothetical protein
MGTSTNVADYQKKNLKTAFTDASVTTSVLLELIANRKTVLGAHHADHEKMGMTEEELAQAHAVLDAKRLTMVNRTVVRWLHDAVYPKTSETPANIKLRSILKTPEVTKILQGEKLTTKSLWATQPWQIPAVHTYVRLAYKFEGMTDMINADLQIDRISRSGEPSLSPAAASSFPQQSRATRSATTASQPHDTSPLSFPDSGESVQVRRKESVQKDVLYLSPQEHKRFKHGKEVPPAAQLQYLKPQLIAQALAHHKFVFTLPKSVRNYSQDLQVMVTKANSIKGTW